MPTPIWIPTPAGAFRAVFTERGLAQLDFPSPASRAHAAGAPVASKARTGTWARQTAAALRAVLEGRNPRVLPPMDWSGATDFQRRVWTALLKIPRGRTRSYAELAASAGRPRAARAAGSACGANRVPVLVPCHRVLAAGGKPGGFTAGLEWKRRLLAQEGVRLSS